MVPAKKTYNSEYILKKKTNRANYVLYLFSPFISLISAIKNYRNSESKNIVWLFVIFYGFTFTVPEGGDGQSYMEYLNYISKGNYSFASFFVDILPGPRSTTGVIDIVSPLLTYLVSLFTDDGRFLMAVFGMVFGYFYSRNIWYLIYRSGARLNITSSFIIIIFSIVIGIEQINVFRFMTAAHVFFFGAIPYILEGDKKKLIIALSSVLFHAAFLLPVLVLITYLLLGKRINIFFIIYVITYFISEINLTFFRNAFAYLPDFFTERYGTYISENRLTKLQVASMSNNFFAANGFRMMYLSVFIMNVYIYLTKQYKIQSPGKLNFSNLFAFSLLFQGVADLISIVPTLHRYPRVGLMFILAFYFLFFQYSCKKKSLNRIILTLTPLIAIFLIFQLRILLNATSLDSIVSNPILSAFLTISKDSIYGLLKQLF
jgi:hypothetical protein